MPQLVGDQVGTWGLAYSTLLVVSTLTAGALIQPGVDRIDHHSSARAVIVSMVVMTVGMLACTVAALLGSPVAALVAAVFLGLAFGIAIVSGMQELQRIAHPDNPSDRCVLRTGLPRVSRSVSARGAVGIRQLRRAARRAGGDRPGRDHHGRPALPVTPSGEGTVNRGTESPAHVRLLVSWATPRRGLVPGLRASDAASGKVVPGRVTGPDRHRRPRGRPASRT